MMSSYQRNYEQSHAVKCRNLTCLQKGITVVSPSTLLIDEVAQGFQSKEIVRKSIDCKIAGPSLVKVYFTFKKFTVRRNFLRNNLRLLKNRKMVESK
jgi:hypothetical protein